MRKLFVFVLAASMLAALAGPAAAKPSRTTYENVGANAFWYSTEWLSRSTYRSTVWYVGIYQSTDSTWSDLYKDVTTCRVQGTRESCTYESLFGFSDLSNGTFTIDKQTLGSAYLDATYDLQSYDGRREPSGTVIPTHITTTWTGVGDLSTDGGTYTFRSKCYSFRGTFDSAFRAAEAYGAVDGVDLGETYDAYLSASTETYVERSKNC